jgi:hypothetical protein
VWTDAPVFRLVGIWLSSWSVWPAMRSLKTPEPEGAARYGCFAGGNAWEASGDFHFDIWKRRCLLVLKVVRSGMHVSVVGSSSEGFQDRPCGRLSLLT